MATEHQPGTRYRETFARAAQDPAESWLEQARTLDSPTPPTRALDYDGQTSWNWFPDGQRNISYQAPARTVQAGRGEEPAVIWDSATTDHQVTCAYAHVLDKVSRFAGALRAHGGGHADRVLAYV